MTWGPWSSQLQYKDTQRGYLRVDNPSKERPPVQQFLDHGVKKCKEGEPFPTAVRWTARACKPNYPAGIEDCDEQTLDKWRANHYAMPPYQFKTSLGVVAADGEERPPNARERERLHGFKPGHTEGFLEATRVSLLGNSFHVIVVAHLLASWAVGMKYMKTIPDTAQLWERAGYKGRELGHELWTRGRSARHADAISAIPSEVPGTPCCSCPHGVPEDSDHNDCDFCEDRACDRCMTHVWNEDHYVHICPHCLEAPGVHRCGLGEERVTVISPPGLGEDVGEDEERILHLVQDEETVTELLQCTVPPDAYYDKLGELFTSWWPKANPALLTHMLSLLIAFDTATAFAMSFGNSESELPSSLSRKSKRSWLVR